METATTGRVTTEAIVENVEDQWAARRGLIAHDAVRRVVIPDALVDTGATMMSLPTLIIQQLGLTRVATKPVIASTGPTTVGVYEPVRLTIMGRSCLLEVLEVPDGVPALVGQVPLEQLDFVVDPQGRRLIGNPAHGGIHTCEMY